MSFKYSCIGDNTPDNREWLEKLGFDKLGAIKGKKYLITDDGYFYATMVPVGYPAVNCIDTPQLFRAVTAMRDDSDYMQWFTDGKSWLNVPIGYDLAGFLYADWDGECGIEDIKKYHKASLEELINHFSGFHHKSEV